MNEEEGGPSPGADPVPPTGPAPVDQPANVLGGIFLIGCGLCLLLVGGGCTGLLIFMLMDTHGSGDLSMLVVSIAIAGGGIFAIVQGVRMARGRRGGG